MHAHVKNPNNISNTNNKQKQNNNKQTNKQRSNLAFSAQSTRMVISGQKKQTETTIKTSNNKHTNRDKIKQYKQATTNKHANRDNNTHKQTHKQKQQYKQATTNTQTETTIKQATVPTTPYACRFVTSLTFSQILCYCLIVFSLIIIV